jgi:hypothetical protein
MGLHLQHCWSLNLSVPTISVQLHSVEAVCMRVVDSSSFQVSTVDCTACLLHNSVLLLLWVAAGSFSTHPWRFDCKDGHSMTYVGALLMLCTRGLLHVACQVHVMCRPHILVGADNTPCVYLLPTASPAAINASFPKNICWCECWHLRIINISTWC